MSALEKNIRFNFKALSELPTVIDQLQTITNLTQQQGKIAADNADQVKSVLLKQNSDTKASAEENLAISKEIARQATLEKKAQLEQQTAQLKASEAQNTAFVKAAAAEQIAIAKQLAAQMVAERTAELEKELVALKESEARQTAETKAAHAERLASVRAALLEQARQSELYYEQMTAEIRAELNQQTIIAKAEAEQQTAIVRGEQQRQTAILKGELAEQRAELKQQGAAFQELRSFIAASFGVYEVIDFTKQIVEAKSKVDIFRTGLQQMIGTKAEADEVFTRLLEMAKTTPFQVENLMEATFSLKAMGTATNELIPTLEVLGNMAAVVGSDKLGFIAKAFTDIQNKGKLMKQELNQFADNGVPLYDLLAVSMGKTRDEIVKLAEAHEISFAQVKKAIFDASQEGGRYYNLMAMQAQTLGGQVSNLADKFFLAKAKLGDYFENGLQKVISGLSDLIELLGGSDSAINRNVAVIKAAVSAWLTYQGVVNAATLVDNVQTAAMTAKNVVIGAGQVIYGAYLIAIRSVTATQDVMTASQMAATVAARGLWTALAANPLGAIIALVGTLVTAYYAYSAVTEEVTGKIGEEALQLKVQQSSLNAVAQAALSAAMGTKERIDYINILKKEFPDYFKGIDSEKVSNEQLKSILDRVNQSYNTRINLARQAYKLESLQSELKQNLEKEAEILATLPTDLQAKYGGSITKAVADMFANPKIFEKINNDWKGQLGFGDFSFDEAKKVSDNLERIGKKITEVDVQIASSGQERVRAAEMAENARWKVQQSELTKGSAEYKKAEADHTAALAKINDTARAKEEAAATGHAGKMKTITLNSQTTIKDILLQSEEMTYEQKKKYYENLEKLEIEQVNKVRVSTKASADEVEAIRKASLEKINEIHTRYLSIQQGLLEIERKQISANIDAEIAAFEKRNAGEREYTTTVTTSFANIAKAAKKRAADEAAAEKDVQSEREKTIKLMEQAADVEEKTRKKIINLIADFAGKASPILGEFAKGILSVIDNVDKLSGKTLEASQNQLANAQAHLSSIQAIYDAGIGGSAKDVEKAKQDVAESRKGLAETKLETASTVFSVMGAVYSVLSAIANAYNEHQRAINQAIATGFAKVREAYKTMYEYVAQASEEAHKQEMESFNGTIDEKIDKIKAYYAIEKEYAIGADRVDATLAYYQQVAQIGADAAGDAQKIIEGMIQLRADQIKREQQMIIDQAEFDKKTAGEVRDAKLAAIDAEVKAFADAKNKEIDAAKAALDAQKAATEQFYSDKQLRLQEDDKYRALLLNQGEAREVAALKAAMQRELERATTAEETADIINAFEKLITDKHKEYADARGNKEKEVSLANQEVKAQEADKVTSLEKATADAITVLQNQIRSQEIRSQMDKTKAALEYANAVKKANQEIFDAQKQMLIAQLQAQIAVLESQKSWTGIGNGRINDAINQINAAIGQIAGIGVSANQTSTDVGGIFSGLLGQQIAENLGTTKFATVVSNGSAVIAAFDEKGNPAQVTYNPNADIKTVWDSNGVPYEIINGDVFIPATGKRWFTGTEYVDDTSRPNGIDTVPAWLTKGERVLTVDQNKALAGITNDELVQRSLLFENMNLPNFDGIWSDISSTKLGLPAGLMGTDGVNALELSELKEETRKTRLAMEKTQQAIANQKLMNVIIDRNGFAVSEVGQQSIVNYNDNIITRS